MHKLELVTKGNHARTLMHADVANEVITRINAKKTVSPNWLGKYEIGKDSEVLDLNGLLKHFSAKVGEAGSINHAWRPVISQEAPLNYQVKTGYVIFDTVVLFPSNRNAEFIAPSNNTSGYFTWLECSFSGGSNVSKAVLTDVAYGSGELLPEAMPPGSTGAPPTKLYIPLFYMTTTETAIDHIEQLHHAPISVSVVVEDFNCDVKIRTFSINS